MKKTMLISKSILACVLISVAVEAESAVSTSSQKIRLGGSIGYTWTSMKQVNKQLNSGVNPKNTGNGIIGMLDLDIAIAPFLMVGARAGYLHCKPASANYDYILYNQTSTINTSLIPLEAGLSLNVKMPASPISITAAVFGGYGFGFASYKNEINAIGQTEFFTQPFKGGGFVGELVAAVHYKLMSHMSININGGYRLAKISQMEQSEDVSYTGIAGLRLPIGVKGDILKDSDNLDLAFDYSGFSIGIGASLDF